MIIKVCGLRDPANLLDIAALNIDMVGYNFYEPSPRYLNHSLPAISPGIKKTGVFVNSSLSTIQEKVSAYQLDYAQLHGDESVAFAEKVHSLLPVIKVFRIGPEFNEDELKASEFCDFFLFDTDSKYYGGSGHKFDWSRIEALDIKVPFLLSGGIAPEDSIQILKINHPLFAGIDINSKFESSPGMKDVALIRKFIDTIKSH